MNEIEMKLKVDDLNAIKKVLESKGCVLSETKHQIDTVFLEKNAQDFNIKTGMIVLRIRTIGDKNLITLKQRKENIIESKEIEFFISDSAKCKQLFETLGYKEMVTIDKKRTTTKYKNFNICLDEVLNLGSFVEIEIVTDEENKSDYYESEILKVCSDLGIDVQNRINSHYDTMLYELKNNH